MKINNQSYQMRIAAKSLNKLSQKIAFSLICENVLHIVYLSVILD
jgi:hypothetical protein